MCADDLNVTKRYILLDQCRLVANWKISKRISFALFYLLFPIIIGIGTRLDGTWTMQFPGKGFSQHYGFWAIFITTPVILLLTSWLLESFVDTLQNINQYCIDRGAELRLRMEAIASRHVRSLALRSPSKWILVFIMFAMLAWCCFNVLKTISPVDTYHHDVFDAYSHPFGFYSAKVYVFLAFTLVYAMAIFVALHVTFSMISILKFLNSNSMLQIDIFHEDNCGGTSRFGNINLMIMSIYVNFFIVICAMYITHRTTYLVMTGSLVASFLLGLAQSVFAVYYIHAAIAQKKRECLKILRGELNQQTALSLTPNGSFPTDLLTLRNHLVDLHTFPYVSGAEIAVNVLRFAPAILAIIGYFGRAPKP